jgi:modulator of FtsH protease HflK
MAQMTDLSRADPRSRPGAGPQPDVEERSAALPSQRRGLVGWVATFVLGAAILVHLSSGFYAVGPDERGVVRRFGAIQAQVGPGWHYRLPWPADQVDVLKTTSVAKVGVGFSLRASSEQVGGVELLTGDTNLLNVALVLQYVIRDPADFLASVGDPRAFVEAAAEAELTKAVVGMPVDEVLTRGRVAIQERVKAGTQEVLDRERSGVQIVSASIMAMTLDRSVAQAFQDVSDAAADREKLINEAKTYENNLIPKARGEARFSIGEAQAYKDRRLAEAAGEAARFVALEAEEEKAPRVTRTRLYLESMERVLPKVRLFVLDSDKGRVPLHLKATGQ